MRRHRLRPDTVATQRQRLQPMERPRHLRLAVRGTQMMIEHLRWASELYIVSDMVDMAFLGIKTAVIVVKSGQRELGTWLVEADKSQRVQGSVWLQRKEKK